MLRLQAPPCLVGLHLDERAGLSSRSQFALVFFDTTCGPSISLRSSRHSPRWNVACYGLVIWWVNCYVVPRLFNVRRFARVWNAGYLFRFFFTERFDLGQDVFPEQWLLVSSFKDPCLHRVVDNSLLLMVLSVPASSQIFLDGCWGPLTRDLPSLQLWMPRPISFMQVSCCGWGN